MNRARNVLVGLLLACVAVACGEDDSSAGSDNADAAEVARDTEAPESSEASDTTEITETTEAPQSTEAPETTEAPTTTDAPVELLHILLTNDDGIGSAGIDAVATAIGALDDVELTLVAPAENQSGSSNSVTDPAPDTAEETQTQSGVTGYAVGGTPADSINYALEYVLDDPPDLVVSGSNEGQNIGPFTPLSGTVGAARTAGVQGIPAFAISQGMVAEGEPDFETGIPYLVDWIEANRESVLAFDGDLGPVWSLNIPSCEGEGQVRGLVEGLPIAPEQIEGVDPFSTDCNSTLEAPDNDVVAFVNGYVTLTEVPAEMVLAEPEARTAQLDVDPASNAAMTVEPATVATAGPTELTVSVTGVQVPSLFVIPGAAPQPCTPGAVDAAAIDQESVDTTQLTNQPVAADGSFTLTITYEVPPEGLVVLGADSGGSEALAVAVCVE